MSDNNQLTKSQMSVEAVLLHHADWKDFKAVILTPPSALDMIPVSILQKRWEMIRCLAHSICKAIHIAAYTINKRNQAHFLQCT
ncbi:MAG TPA: hypothetical protein DD755_13865 [Erysipelotrichaceae bacterium]|nr:hypothetical protein [Erysipelotrichaceae bacterium]